VNGRFKLSLSPDMSYAWVSFDKDVHVSLAVECEVTWGIVNVPLQATIEGMVKKGFDDWLHSALVEPNRMRISILADKNRDEEQLTDADIAKAESAAHTARKRTPVEESWTSGIASMVSLSVPSSPSGAAYAAQGRQAVSTPRSPARASPMASPLPTSTTPPATNGTYAEIARAAVGLADDRQPHAAQDDRDSS
jgi:hypothetical protein